MNSLKIGDRIKIISLREVLPFGFIDPMKKYCGKEGVIKYRYKFNEKTYYRIDLDKQLFLWDSNMFEMDVKNLLRNE